MKTLQNNYTTSEQSKRLLELGVPADSADCFYCNEYKYKPNADAGSIHLSTHIRESQFDLSHSLFNDDFYIPCWSVGRLIEIFELCSGVLWQDTAQPSVKQPTLIERVIDTIVLFNKHGHMDFSKLED